MRELLTQTWSNLMAHKLRSFLTMFGIVWGVISIVLLSALSAGFQQGNMRVLKELGKNIIIIRNGRTSAQAGGERAGKIIRLEISDVYALKEKAILLEHVTPELMRGGVSAKSAFNASSTQVSGVWPVYQYIRTIEVDRGRLLSEQDNSEARRVVVIGYEMYKQLFADRDAIGQQIQLNGIPYTVIGRVRKKEQDSNYTGPDNNRLFMPYETMRKDFPMAGNNVTPDHVSAIIAAPYEHVAEELNRIVEREGKINFEKIGPVESEILSIAAARDDFEHARILHLGEHHHARPGRRGRDEHHAHLGQGADKRDRRPQSPRRDLAQRAVAVLQRGAAPDAAQRNYRIGRRRRAVQTGQSAAAARAVFGNDHHVAGGGVRRRSAGADRDRGGDLSGAAGGRPASD